MATEQSVMAVMRASRPTFRNLQDKVAFAVNACFLADGYVLNATGPPAFADDALTSSSTDEVGMDNWNELEDNYGFLYLKNSKKVLMKCLVMNDMLFVDALKEGTSSLLHLQLRYGDYVGEDGGTNYTSQFKNLKDLVELVNNEVLNKLSSSSSQSSSSEARGGLRDNTDSPNSGVTDPQGSQPYPYGLAVPPVYPGVGDADLYPGPGAGMYPSRGGFGSGGGGMLVGPNDPSFFGQIGQPGFPGGTPGVPPGARFDPYGPPGVPGFEPNRFVRNPRRPGGGGTHPDLQHFGDGSDFI